jgi:hypothetical protein
VETVEQAYSEIAKIHNIPKTADGYDAKYLVKQYLNSHVAGKWILIIDNADDMDLLFGTDESEGISAYLPSTGSGLILFTTRHQRMEVSLAENEVIEVREMDKQEAVSFMEKSLIRKHLIHVDDQITAELLKELTYLPLAITQAVAYLNINTNVSILKYLQLMRTTEQNLISLMSQEFHDGTRYTQSANAIAKTWLVSFDQIHKLDAAAADLLLFMSLIEPKGIPLSILPSLPPRLDEELTRAIGTLCAYSFIVQRGDEEVYDVHRLVQLGTRIWAEARHLTSETIEKAIRHVSNIFPRIDYNTRTIWRKYAPHALRLLSVEDGESMEERDELCYLIGMCLWDERIIREAVIWVEKSYEWRKDNLTEDHHDRLSSQHTLAFAYNADGQVDSAIQLLEHVVTVRTKALAVEHPNRLASQHELARAYLADGQVEGAIQLLEHDVAVEAKVFAMGHPDRLSSQHTLAGAYLADGQVEKAI